MKTRSDFVSNSSSCSFFIELDTQEAVDAFKAIAERFDRREVAISLYQDFDAVCRWDPWQCIDFWNCSDDDISQVSKLEVGNWVKCDAGEDHDEQYMQRFSRMAEVVDSSVVKFKIYEDPDAHTTYCGALAFPEY